MQIDQHRAKRAGLTSSDIAQTLQSYFSGAQITEYREQDEIIPIILRADVNERNSLDRLRTLNVYSQKTGKAVPLFQVADFAPINQFSMIQHKNMFRTISIQARNSEMSAEDLKLIIDKNIDALRTDLPINHIIEYDGVIVDSAKAQQALSASMPMVLGLILITYINSKGF